jgi:hypothetical protein
VVIVRTRGVGLLGPALVLALGAVACSGSDGNSGIPSAGGAASSGVPSLGPVAEAFLWAQCMREQGIDMPDPVVAAGKRGPQPQVDFENPQKGSAEAAALNAAMAACEQYASFIAAAEAGGGREAPMSDAEIAAWRAFAQCMRDNGVEVADPDPMSEGVSVPDANRHPDQAAVIEAAKTACADLFSAARLARTVPG